MQSVSISYFRTHTGEVLRRVRDEWETIEITYCGRPIARLVPASDPFVPAGDFPEPASGNIEDVWADIDKLAEEIGNYWPPGLSAVDAIREERR